MGEGGSGGEAIDVGCRLQQLYTESIALTLLLSRGYRTVFVTDLPFIIEKKLALVVKRVHTSFLHLVSSCTRRNLIRYSPRAALNVPISGSTECEILDRPKVPGSEDN